MPALNTIPVDKLVRLIGTTKGPTIIDVRTEEDFAARPVLIPSAFRRSIDDVSDWAPAFAGQNIVVVCREGHKLSHGAAAWLRQAGAQAEALDGGIVAWDKAGYPVVPEGALPPRDAQGRTVSVGPATISDIREVEGVVQLATSARSEIRAQFPWLLVGRLSACGPDWRKFRPGMGIRGASAFGWYRSRRGAGTMAFGRQNRVAP